MICAIYGHTWVGKTTVARVVAAELRLPLRSCGNVVRERALTLDAGIRELPDVVHQNIDEETSVWVVARQPCVV